MPPLTNPQIGALGVNVDKSPLELDDKELRRAQNAVHDVAGAVSLQKRPGLIPVNTDEAAGPVLGGTIVPLTNRLSGLSAFYIGRESVEVP